MWTIDGQSKILEHIPATPANDGHNVCCPSRTPEDEYSAIVMPEGDAISVVRVEMIHAGVCGGFRWMQVHSPRWGKGATNCC
jgi:hypothetical protein